MNFLRKHWYDLGIFLSVIVGIYIYIDYKSLTDYEVLMWLSLISLFWHQAEEYRIVGTFPGMLNSVMFKSKIPGRYPLNTNSALCVNVLVGWVFYFLAAVLSEKAVWLGIATILVSAANVIAHTFIFNFKGKTIYNAGLASCWLLFIPCVCFFVSIVYDKHLASMMDLCFGIVLGVILNVAGIFKLIELMADKNTPFIFEKRNLLPKDRNKTKI